MLAGCVLVVGCSEGAQGPDNPVPAIELLEPALVDAGTTDVVLIVRGRDFVRSATVRFNAQTRPTEYVSAAELRATLDDADVAQAGVGQIVVINPSPGGGPSNVALLTIAQAQPSGPKITSLSPDHATASAGALTVTLVGSGFTTMSVVTSSARELPTEFVSPATLRFGLSASDVASPDTLFINVMNRDPALWSAQMLFEVRSPVPSITSLASTSTTAGQPGFALRVNGSGFLAESQVRFNGAQRQTRLVGPGLLEADLLEGDLRAAGSFTISVSNPAPGGGTSNTVPFEVRNGTPEIVLLPSRAGHAGRDGFDLIVHGRGFVPGSVVRWDGADRPTSYISGDRVQVTIGSSDLILAGARTITVHNPPPGGGTSAPVPFIVRSLPPALMTDGRAVDIAGQDVLAVPATGMVYVGTDLPPIPNSVVAINGLTGAITGSIAMGRPVLRLGLSDGDRYLYAAQWLGNVVRRIDLAAFVTDLEWSLPAGQWAGDIAVVPDQPDVVAIARLSSPGGSAGVAIYGAGVQRPVIVPPSVSNTWIEFLESPSILYGFDDFSSAFGLHTMAIESDGIRLVSGADGLFSGGGGQIEGAAGRLYSANGSIVDAERTALVGTIGSAAQAVLPDPDLGRIFAITTRGIEVYDLNNFTRLGSISFADHDFSQPAVNWPRLVRWSADGLAFLGQGKLFLIRSPLFGP